MTPMSRPVVTVGLVAMVLSSVLCASLLSHTDRSLSGHAFILHIARPTAKAIMLILRQKCQEWKDQGVANLPSYCYIFLANNNLSANQLDRFYDEYANQVSAAERFQDLQRAQSNMVGNSLRAARGGAI
ncbi:hypothetical protein ACOMHN_049355 [Nucella lapillus]